MEGRAYSEVHAFVLGLGGTMVWRAGGHGGGGDWVLRFRGRELVVPIDPHPSRAIGLLDKLYVQKARMRPPKQWDEDAWEATLMADAFWALVTDPRWKLVT